jgi:hypothetical protein
MLRKTMKTALLASVALSALIANTAIADDSAFDGVYVGAEAGMGFGKANIKDDVNPKSNKSGNGLIGGLFLGYGADI